MLDAINRLLAETAVPTAANGDARATNRLSLEGLFALLDLIPTPILLATNANATDIRSNLKGLALFKSARSQNLSQSAPEDERPAFEVWCNGRLVAFENLPMQRAALTGSPVRGSECELRFSDGETRFISGNVDPLFAADGSVRGSIGVFLDITELKLLERENALRAHEVAHRARNSVSLIQLLARQSLRPKLSVEDYDSFESRLVALGRSMELTMPSG